MSLAGDELADRIRDLIGQRPGMTSKRMFGGTCFMLEGNMVVCAMKPGSLLVRVGAEGYEAALGLPGVQPMVMGERTMSGFVEVADDIANDDDLMEWVDRALEFVRTLPPKAPASPKRPRTPATR